MRDWIKICLVVIVATTVWACNYQRKSDSKEDACSERINSIYHWKTCFDLDSAEISFLWNHNIRRIYLRMFDVALEQDHLNGTLEIVPIATTKFVTHLPDSIEIVPVTYITIEALRAMAGDEKKFASLIVERVLAMSSYNKCGKIREIQMDCDWTGTTSNSYWRLCVFVRDLLAPKNIKLSITVRLHQLNETPPPVASAVLMLYNTGALKNPETKNSILDIDDVKPYIKQMKYPLPLDYAYPVFGWGVMFENNDFVSILSADSIGEISRGKIRYERTSVSEVLEVKQLIEENLGKPWNGNILYHLDDSQLKNYTNDEINQILSY